MTSRTTALVLVLGLLSACRHDGGGSQPTPDGGNDDVWAGDMCGDINHLDDPAVFVGSCVLRGGCIEYTTKPMAPAIGTGCLMAACAMNSGTWSSEACPSGYVYCSMLTDPDGMSWVAYSNPGSPGCPMM